jgi:predicted nuclease with TOPRIM domain
MTKNTTVKEMLNNIVIPRLERVEAKLFEHDKKFEEHSEELRLSRNEMMTHFDRLYKKFEDLNTEYVFINAALRRAETTCSTRAEVKTLEGRVIKLEGRVDGLDRSLGNIAN